MAYQPQNTFPLCSKDIDVSISSSSAFVCEHESLWKARTLKGNHFCAVSRTSKTAHEYKNLHQHGVASEIRMHSCEANEDDDLHEQTCF